MDRNRQERIDEMINKEVQEGRNMEEAEGRKRLNKHTIVSLYPYHYQTDP